MPDRVETPWGQSKTDCPLSISPREKLILSLAARGLTDGEIALQLNRSPRTVQTHLNRVRDRLGAVDRTNAVVLALARQLISFDAILAL
jgi:DNA-binding NarL/FixJ family response regulator